MPAVHMKSLCFEVAVMHPVGNKTEKKLDE